jgi:hypothetical protein
MFMYPFPDVAGPGLIFGLLTLGGLALLIIFVLIVFIETVVLQVMQWGGFKSSLKASFLMNLISTLFGLAALFLVTRWPIPGLLISWGLSILIEGLVLMKLDRTREKSVWRISAVANLASYLLLIFPAYLLSR